MQSKYITAPIWRFRIVARVFQRSNIITPWMQFCTNPYRGSNIITLRKRFRVVALACCNANESNLCHPEETVSRRGFLIDLHHSSNITTPIRQIRTAARGYHSSNITAAMRRFFAICRVFRARFSPSRGSCFVP